MGDMAPPVRGAAFAIAHAWPSHIPGLKVVVPSTPCDEGPSNRDSRRQSSRLLRDKISYRKVRSSAGQHVIPLGVADVKREGQTSRSSPQRHGQVALGAAAARGRGDQRRSRRSAAMAARREDDVESVKKTSR